ncbi:hypothetical protein H112_03235, partial [Trichophyton rubrum D6]
MTLFQHTLLTHATARFTLETGSMISQDTESRHHEKTCSPQPIALSVTHSFYSSASDRPWFDGPELTKAGRVVRPLTIIIRSIGLALMNAEPDTKESSHIRAHPCTGTEFRKDKRHSDFFLNQANKSQYSNLQSPPRWQGGTRNKARRSCE